MDTEEVTVDFSAVGVLVGVGEVRKVDVLVVFAIGEGGWVSQSLDSEMGRGFEGFEFEFSAHFRF